MPSVPRDESRVRETEIPGVRLTPSATTETFGGGASAEAVGKGVRELSEIGQKIAFQADEIAAQDADFQMAQLQSRLETESRNMRGRDAAGAIDYVDSEWGKGLSDIEKSLTNNRQKLMFQRTAAARYASLNQDTQRYMASEFRRYDAESTDSYLANAKQTALNKFADPEAVNLSIYQQQEAIKKYAARNGMDDGQTKDLIRKHTSQTVVPVINSLIVAGEMERASQYESAFADVLDQKDMGMIANTKTHVVEAIKKANERAQKDAYNQNVQAAATELLNGTLTTDKLQGLVTSGLLLPDDAKAFQVAMYSPKQWKEIENDPNAQADAGVFYVNAVNALEKGAELSTVLTNAVQQYNAGKIDQTDLAWILRAANMKNQPAQKSLWQKFTSLLPVAIRNFGASGSFDFMRSWDFKTEPKEHYKQFLDSALAGGTGIEKAPKYLINAYGFLRKLFDGEEEGPEKPKSEDAKSKDRPRKDA